MFSVCSLWDRKSCGFEAWSLGFIRVDIAFVLECQADVIQPLHEAVAREVVDVERQCEVITVDRPSFEVHGDFDPRLVFDALEQQIDVALFKLGYDKAVLSCVSAEDVGKA